MDGITIAVRYENPCATGPGTKDDLAIEEVVSSETLLQLLINTDGNLFTSNLWSFPDCIRSGQNSVCERLGPKSKTEGSSYGRLAAQLPTFVR